MTKLEQRLLAAKKGEIIEVKTPKQRTEAYRIALRSGFTVITRSKLIGKGYEVVRS